MKRKKIAIHIISGFLCAFFIFCLCFGLTAQGVVAGVIANNSGSVDKREYIEKNEEAELGTEENPFTILEIVPNQSMGKMGYLIPGCEPIDMDKLAVSNQIGTYKSMFATSQTGETVVANVEELSTKKFADQIPEGAVTDRPWGSEDERLLKMLESRNAIVDASQSGAYGAWSFRYELYTEEGYYEYVGDGNGYFDLVSTQVEVEADEEPGAGDGTENGAGTEMGDGTGTGAGTGTETGAGTGDGNGTGTETGDGTENGAGTETGDGTETGAGTETGDRAGTGTETGTEAGNQNTKTETVYEFVYNENHEGSYNWVEAENTNGIEADYTADKVWTTREDYYFEYRENIITNNDTLIKNVFDTTTEAGFVSQVITLTPDDLTQEESLALIDSADMIVIGQDTETNIRTLWNATKDDEYDEVPENAPTSFAAQGNDVPWAAVKRIVERMASEDPAALVLDSTTFEQKPSTNLTKLAIMLLEYDAAVFVDCYFDDIDGNGTYTDSAGKKHETWVCSMDSNQNTFDLSLAKNDRIQTGASNGFIEDNIYVYGGYNVLTHGFERASYSEDEYNRDAFDYFEDFYGQRPEALSAREFIQYILGGYSYKSTLRILEVEPTNLYIYPGDSHIASCKDDDCEECEEWIMYYRRLIPWMKGDIKSLVKSGKLEITRMASWEFIGKIEDLNADYDLIIFGATQNAANGLNGYNDLSMNGLLYSNIGDLVAGKNGDGVRQFSNKAMQDGATTRYSGNDLTEKKLQELKNFLSGNQAIVVDGDFYDRVWVNGGWANKVNTDKVDISSYVYQLLLLAETGNEDEVSSNIFVLNDSYSDFAYDLKKLTAIEDCELEFYTLDGGTGYPTEYTYESESDGTIIEDTVTYVDSGTFTYQFRINGSSSATYGVSLYIDRNGDGIYEASLKENVLSESDESEEVTGLTVVDMNGNAVRANALEAGVWYQVSKELPSNYVGILPWKLEVYNVDNTEIRDNEIKYSAIRTTEETRESIMVLQINPSVYLGSTTSQPSGVIMATEGYGSTDQNAKKFQKYLGAVEDFDVTVIYLSNADWRLMFGDGSGLSTEERVAAWEEYLDGFDMLMLGFKDTTEFPNNTVFQKGFEYFVNSGKSVILAHDLVKDESYLYDSSAKSAVSNYDDKIRDLMQQRRYNTTYVELQGEQISLINSSTLSAWNNLTNLSNYTSTFGQANGRLGKLDISSLTTLNENGELIPNCGDNSTDLYIKYGPGGSNSSAAADRDCYSNGTAVGFPYTTTYVNICNTGQITTYPYTLGSVIRVAATHSQYCQLNLDSEDMVVWYSLTDSNSAMMAEETGKTTSNTGRGLYSSRESDVRNNFYIYNVGNITYTGMGHSNSALMPDDEVMLFVNTMISAYRATSDNPYVEVTNEDKVERSQNDVYLYLPVDEGNIDYSDDTYKVELTVTDPSWVTSQTESKETYLQFVDENGNVLQEQELLYSAGNDRVVETEELSDTTVTTTDKYVYLYLNSNVNWSNAYCYVYSSDSSGRTNAGWPGAIMTKVSDGVYRYKVPSNITNPKVIVNGGGNTTQYPKSTGNSDGIVMTEDLLEITLSGRYPYTGTVKQSSGTSTGSSASQTAYKVDVDGNYYFYVNYQDLLAEGKKEYYLCLKSVYTKNGYSYSGTEITKVTVLPMPLFDLN